MSAPRAYMSPLELRQSVLFGAPELHLVGIVVLPNILRRFKQRFAKWFHIDKWFRTNERNIAELCLSSKLLYEPSHDVLTLETAYLNI